MHCDPEGKQKSCKLDKVLPYVLYYSLVFRLEVDMNNLVEVLHLGFITCVIHVKGTST